MSGNATGPAPAIATGPLSAARAAIGTPQALAAPPEPGARVESRPVPGRPEPPVSLGDTDERVEPQVLHAADRGDVREDDQRPRQAGARGPFQVWCAAKSA